MNVNITVFDLFYKLEKDKPVVYLEARNNSDNSRLKIKVTEFYPYFYIEISDNKKSLDKINQIITKNPEVKNWIVDIKGIETIFNKIKYHRGKMCNVVKVVGIFPPTLPKIKSFFEKENFTCHEYDIPFVHRFLLDSSIRCVQPYNLNEINVDQHGVVEIPFTDIKNKIGSKSSIKETSSILIASIDIETGNTEETSFQELIAKKENYVIAISISTAWLKNGKLGEINTKSFVLPKKDAFHEKMLFQDFLSYLDNLDPDIVVSFNGDSFDYEYLFARFKNHDLNFVLGNKQNLVKSGIDKKYRMSGKAFVDLYPKSWLIHTKSGRKRLKDVAEYYFQESEPNKLLKLNIPKLPGELWNSGKMDVLKDYVEQDTIITLEIAEKMLTGDLAVAEVNGFPISDVLLSTGRVNGEFELMRILEVQNTLIPPKPKGQLLVENKKKRKEHPHSGGQVITPTSSNANNVVIADFVSMYPTLMKSKNIGSESFIHMGKFESTPPTTLAILQKGIIEKRLKIKSLLSKNNNLSKDEQITIENQQKALKLVANSMYGATLYAPGRFFDIEVCNSITEMARHLMNELFSLAKDYGNRNNILVNVIYSDTDSVFIQILPKGQISNKNLLPWLTHQQKLLLEFLNKHVPSGMELSLEDIAKRIIFQKMADKDGELRKKAYAYFSLVTEKLKIKGFEAIRTDLSEFTKETQEELFFILLNENNPNKKAIKYLKKQINILRIQNESILLPKLIISGIIRRPPKKYKSITPAVGAFLHYCNHFHYDPETHYINFARFPFIITTKGKRNDPIFKKARHPDLVKSEGYKINRDFYVAEIIRIAEKFDLTNPEELKNRNLFDFL